MSKIILRGIGDNEISVIKDIRDLLNVDLNQAREVAEIVKKGDELELTVADAEFALSVLSSSGADVCLYDEDDSLDEIGAENTSCLSGSLIENLKKCKEVYLEGYNAIKKKEEAESQIAFSEKIRDFKASIGWGLIPTFAGAFIVGFACDAMFPEISSSDNFLWVIIGELVVVFFIYWRFIWPQRVINAENWFKEDTENYTKQVNESDEFIKKWENAPETVECYSFLTKEYWDSEKIDYLISLVECKRADSLKEAINLYEEIQYRNRMENMQQEQLSAMKETNQRITSLQETTATLEKHAANTERYAKSAAHSAKVGNVIGAVNTVQLHNVSKHTKK